MRTSSSGEWDELRQSCERRRDKIPIRLWLFSSTKVAQCPCSIPEHAQLVLFGEQSEKRSQCSCLNNIVTTSWAISCNVSQRPNSLLANVENWGRQQVDKVWNSPSVDDNHRMLSCSRSNIRECPCSFKLGNLVSYEPREADGVLTCKAGCGPAKNSTNRGTTPHCMILSMGGLSSFESSFLSLVVVLYLTSWFVGKKQLVRLQMTTIKSKER